MDSILFFVCLFSVSTTNARLLPPPIEIAQTENPTPFWSEYGKLVKTKLRCDDGRPIYALMAKEKRLIYVSTMTGKSLVDYEGRTVAVFGITVDVPTAPVKFLRATHVAVP